MPSATSLLQISPFGANIRPSSKAYAAGTSATARLRPRRSPRPDARAACEVWNRIGVPPCSAMTRDLSTVQVRYIAVLPLDIRSGNERRAIQRLPRQLQNTQLLSLRKQVDVAGVHVNGRCQPGSDRLLQAGGIRILGNLARLP